MKDIITASDLFQEILTQEKEILNQKTIKHPPTIGHMYEGLTGDLLKKNIFEGLGLRVIKNSFLQGCDTEFDVMLTVGEGEIIPHTESQYIYPLEKVIAVIQVKKNLYSKDIGEGYGNLKEMGNFYLNSNLTQQTECILNDAFKSICKKPINENLSLYEKHICGSLIMDATVPVRIIQGYNGFKSENALRDSFVKFLENNVSPSPDNLIHGFSPSHFPNLIICDQYSLIKTNGMPYGTPVDKDSWWHILVSSSHNPAYFFLEVIWSRLSYLFELDPCIFGDDLQMEPMYPFIEGRIQEKNNLHGWEYRYRNGTFEKQPEISEWAPTEIDTCQHTILAMLCDNHEVDIENDSDLENFVKDGGYKNLEDFVQKLQDANFIYIDKGKLRLLTEQLQCICYDGKFYAGENKSGRLSNWLLHRKMK